MEDNDDKRLNFPHAEDVAAHDKALSDIDVARLKRAIADGFNELICGVEHSCTDCHTDVGDLYMLEWCVECDGFLHARCVSCFARKVHSDRLVRFDASETIDERRVTPGTSTFVRMRANMSTAAAGRTFFPDMMLFYAQREV